MVNEISARNFAFIWKLDNPLSVYEFFGIEPTTPISAEAQAELSEVKCESEPPVIDMVASSLRSSDSPNVQLA